MSLNNLVNTVTIDAFNRPAWQVKEDYRLVNRTEKSILVKNRGAGTQEIEFYYPDFVLINEHNLFYDAVTDNEAEFTLGKEKFVYVRENNNSAWRNERSVELGLGKYFYEKYKDIFEIGDVCPHYSFFKEWPVLDPFGPYQKAIRKDVMDYDYTGLNVLSISTFEHMNQEEYQNNDPDLGIKALKKVVNEAKNYLITIPVGGWRKIENFLKNQKEIKYTFMRRKNIRGETNNWAQDSSLSTFDLPYGHFSYAAGYYGNALAICVITNDSDLLN